MLEVVATTPSSPFGAIVVDIHPHVLGMFVASLMTGERGRSTNLYTPNGEGFQGGEPKSDGGIDRLPPSLACHRRPGYFCPTASSGRILEGFVPPIKARWAHRWSKSHWRVLICSSAVFLSFAPSCVFSQARLLSPLPTRGCGCTTLFLLRK